MTTAIHSGPLLVCVVIALCSVVVVVGSLRLARLELAKPHSVGVGDHLSCCDPRVFDAYRASALFGGWTLFWSGAGITDALIGLGPFHDMLFETGELFIGLLFWAGLLGAIAVFLIYRRREHLGKHPCCQQQQGRTSEGV